MRRLFGSLLLGLSAATISLTPVAEQLLRLTPARLYFMRAVPDRLDYWIFLALVIVLGLPAGLTHYASFFAPPVWRRVLEAPFGVLCIMGGAHLVQLHLSRYPPLLNAVTAQWARVGVASVDGWFIVSLACGVIVVGVFSCWPWGWMAAKPMLCGAASVVWLACGWALIRPPVQIPDPRPAEANLHSVREMGSGSPVVWIILDEWDYDLTFRRTDGKTFPQFERLRNQSMFLDNVKAAAPATLQAIPGLLMGRTVREYRPTASSGARFVAVGAAESFPGPRTIFDTATHLGYFSQIVGWYHPYCRIFSGQLGSCWWDDWRMQFLRPGGSVAERTTAMLRESVELEALPAAGLGNVTLRQLERVGPMIERASIAASRPGRTFSFLHLPVPHAPFFKLDPDGRMLPLPTDDDGYPFGLEAADRALGSVRFAMEKAGVWEEALVVVSSDHPYRHQFEGGYGNGHIPMMIKFPHQSVPVVYSHPFQAVETKNLIEDFMLGTVATPEKAVAWMDHGIPAAGAQRKGSMPVSLTRLAIP